jgi:hypothetical protein
LRFYIPEDGILHSHRRENLKSYLDILHSHRRENLKSYLDILHSHRRENLKSYIEGNGSLLSRGTQNLVMRFIIYLWGWSGTKSSITAVTCWAAVPALGDRW